MNEKEYFWVQGGGDDGPATITGPYSRSVVLKRIADANRGVSPEHQLRFWHQVPEDPFQCAGHVVTLIEGRVVVPREKHVVVEYDL